MVLPLLHAVLKWNLLSNPLSLYGRRLCRTVPACCTGTTCQNVRALQMLAAADILTLFSEKNQKPNSAHRCPITSIQVLTESQKLSKFSCVTFRSLNRGRPPFQPQSLKITSFGHVKRGGGKVQLQQASLILPGAGALGWAGGRGGEEGSTIQVKVGGGICPCLLYLPFHFSFASFWLAVRLFLDKKFDR